MHRPVVKRHLPRTGPVAPPKPPVPPPPKPPTRSCCPPKPVAKPIKPTVAEKEAKEDLDERRRLESLAIMLPAAVQCAVYHAAWKAADSPTINLGVFLRLIERTVGLLPQRVSDSMDHQNHWADEVGIMVKAYKDNLPVHTYSSLLSRFTRAVNGQASYIKWVDHVFKLLRTTSREHGWLVYGAFLVMIKPCLEEAGQQC